MKLILAFLFTLENCSVTFVDKRNLTHHDLAQHVLISKKTGDSFANVYVGASYFLVRNLV